MACRSCAARSLCFVARPHRLPTVAAPIVPVALIKTMSMAAAAIASMLRPYHSPPASTAVSTLSKKRQQQHQDTEAAAFAAEAPAADGIPRSRRPRPTKVSSYT